MHRVAYTYFWIAIGMLANLVELLVSDILLSLLQKLMVSSVY